MTDLNQIPLANPTITPPVTLSTPPPPVAPPSPQLPTTPATPVGKVVAKVLLLVEDDPLLVNMYHTKFATEGFQVFTATDGEVGLNLAQEHLPDIIVLDIMMPRLDGIEVLRALRQNPTLKNIPVLMLSNLSELAKQKEAMELGAKEFLIKANLTPTQVVAKIKQHLSIR